VGLVPGAAQRRACTATPALQYQPNSWPVDCARDHGLVAFYHWCHPYLGKAVVDDRHRAGASEAGLCGICTGSNWTLNAGQRSTV